MVDLPGAEPDPGAPLEASDDLVGFPAGLDPVDIARLGAPLRTGATSTSVRWITLGMVFVVFVVLMVLGVWLAARVHSSGLSAGVHAPALVGTVDRHGPAS
jgi:hypothetical protein